MVSATKILGNGIYGFAEAGRLTHVNPRTVRAWFRGRTKHGARIGRGPVFKSQYDEDSAISFLDLIEVLVAGNLRTAGVPLASIRRSFAAISKHLADSHPFSREEIVTDGQHIFLHTAGDDSDDQLVELFQRQHFFHKVMKPYLLRVQYDKNTKLAKSWQIMDGVVVDPARSFGKPLVESAGIAASILAASYFSNGENADAVADWYGVASEDVEVAARFSENYAGRTG